MILPAALSLLVLGALVAIVLLVRRNSKYLHFDFLQNNPCITLIVMVTVILYELVGAVGECMTETHEVLIPILSETSV